MEEVGRVEEWGGGSVRERDSPSISSGAGAVFIRSTIGKKETLTGLNFSLIVKPPPPPPSLHPSTFSSSGLSITTNNPTNSTHLPSPPLSLHPLTTYIHLSLFFCTFLLSPFFSSSSFCILPGTWDWNHWLTCSCSRKMFTMYHTIPINRCEEGVLVWK